MANKLTSKQHSKLAFIKERLRQIEEICEEHIGMLNDAEVVDLETDKFIDMAIETLNNNEEFAPDFLFKESK